MRKRFGLDSTLRRGSGGIFDVTYRDELLFSKHELGRFPKPGEVEELLNSRVG